MCATCGAALEVRDIANGVYRYRCVNNHWWELAPNTGWLAIPEPADAPNPNAAGVAIPAQEP
jgi:hypothetical protein